MKTIQVIVFVLFVVCLVFPAGAQVNLGIIGGLNLANCDINPLDEGLEKSGIIVFGVGGILDVSLNEFIGLRLEPMYLQKGAKAEWDIYEMETKIAYIEIPVMLRYAFDAGNIKPYLIAGPAIGYLLSSKGKSSGGEFSEEEDMKDVTKSFNFGLGFGAGMNLPMGKNFIFLEARYSFGLTNVNDDPEDPDTEVKTRDIQIFAGFTFPLDGK